VHNVAKGARHTFTALAGTQAQRQAMVDKFMAQPDDDPISPSSFTADALRHALSVASASSAMNVWNQRLQPQTLPTVSWRSFGRGTAGSTTTSIMTIRS